MVRIQMRGGFGALLMLGSALLLALLAFTAGLAFLLPLAALGLLAAAVRFLSGLLTGRRRDPSQPRASRLPASGQVVEIAPVETAPVEATPAPIAFLDERTGALGELVGKRIAGFAYGDDGGAGPASQLFLFFDDGTSYEVYTSSGSMVLSRKVHDWPPGGPDTL